MIITKISFGIRDLFYLKCVYSNNFELNLKHKLMKNLILGFILIFTLQCVTAQKNSLEVQNSSEYYTAYNEYFKKVTFKLGGGVLLPQGVLKNYFGVSPLIELSVDFPVTETKSLELALQFVIPNQQDTFNYVRSTDTINAKASFLFNPMLRFKKNLSASKATQLHIGLGLGASVIKTDARNPFYTGSDSDDEKYEVITAFLVAPTLDYVKTFNNNEQLTFSLGFHYSPYKIEGALQENIGSISLTPRIMYSF